ncbi:MAG: Phage shock protein PspC (Stress-responsive transcriptional regulator), partial [Ilumatobacteraceae bacterium]|nr:Phage shock protein PspC (Stress-responsive transcriptional regulator) [Ilumatobacteraceae bacterium]
MVLAAAMADPGAMNEQTDTIDAPAFPPPPPPAGTPPAPQRRWYQLPVARDPSDRKVGGVVSGLSRTYGFDVRTTRIAVLIATVVLPVLIVLYLAAWMLLPDTPQDATSFEHIVRDRRRMPVYIAIGIVLLAGGVGSFSSWFFFGGVSWGFALVAIGVLLWAAPGLTRSSNASNATNATAGSTVVPPPPTPTTTFTDAPVVTDAQTFSERPTTVQSSVASTLWTGGAPLTMTDVRPRRKRRPIASLVTLAVLAFIGIAAAGDALDWWNIPVLTTVVVSLIGTAVGAVISAIVNRSWIALPVVPLLAVVTTGLLITHP